MHKFICRLVSCSHIIRLYFLSFFAEVSLWVDFIILLDRCTAFDHPFLKSFLKPAKLLLHRTLFVTERLGTANTMHGNKSYKYFILSICYIHFLQFVSSKKLTLEVRAN